MRDTATVRMILEAKQPLLDVLKCLSPHSSKIHSAWRALLKRYEPCGKYLSLLSSLRLTQDDLNSPDPLAYRERSERQGRDLCARGVPVECVAAAVDLYIEGCLPYLLTHEPDVTRILAFVRWASLYRFFVLAGYAEFQREERRSMDEGAMQAEKRSQDFAAQLGDAYEAERRRLAQDLHDEIGHDLIVLKLYTEVIALDLKKGDTAQLRRKLRESVRLIQHALKRVRHLTFDLGPGIWNEQGFVPAIRLYLRQFSRRTGIKVRLEAARMRAKLPGRCETALYKVLQGALANVAAHADARNVKVSLSSSRDSAIMKIEDDGRGFNVRRTIGIPPESYGLRAMRERIELLGGAIHFVSRTSRGGAESRGTVVEAHLPLHDTDSA